MGIDCSLQIVSGRYPGCVYAHSMLEVKRDGTVNLDTIARSATQYLPEPEFACFQATTFDGEPGYGTVSKDKYGRPLRATTAGDLAKLPWPTEGWNCAVGQFLTHLPPETLIVPFWH